MRLDNRTPGEWVVEDLGINCFLISGEVEQAGTTGPERDYYNRIASVTQRDPHPTHGGGISRAEALANARAMAQAKNLLNDLLAVLAECKEMFVTAAGERPYEDVLSDFEQQPYVRLARESIRKATHG